MAFSERIKQAWNAFTSRDPTPINYGVSYGIRNDRPFIMSNNNTLINSIYNRIATSASSVDILHAKIDDNNKFLEVINSGINNCLSRSANIDQTGRQFIIDSVLTLLDEGVMCLVPIDKNIEKIKDINGIDIIKEDIESIRVGRIVTWYPRNVKVNVYNDQTGIRKILYYQKNQ